MKFYFLFLLFCLPTLYAQETIWMDKQWNKVSKEKATYYRPKPAKLKDGFWIVDYYKNGEVKREGFGLKRTLNNEKFDGLVVEYHPNSKTAIKKNYKNGKLHGLCREYFESGELKNQYRYRNGKRNGIWKEFYKTGKIKTKGKYRDGEKVGIWKTFYKNVYEGILDY